MIQNKITWKKGKLLLWWWWYRCYAGRKHGIGIHVP